jgi:hypothetical protein
MRRAFTWISFVLSLVVVAGVVVQIYLIASWIFGESGALDAHQIVGGAVVHPAEVLVFSVSLGAWWRTWRNIGVSFSLALLGNPGVSRRRRQRSRQRLPARPAWRPRAVCRCARCVYRAA